MAVRTSGVACAMCGVVAFGAAPEVSAQQSGAGKEKQPSSLRGDCPAIGWACAPGTQNETYVNRILIADPAVVTRSEKLCRKRGGNWRSRAARPC